eukprot:TRINITY_DN24048_c0_g1_i1.p1 TRINITY_DN24048_c0_g1~~TRINITY_DN24048_c0_g1_i1.p1  ORF type:complete len:253 (+),score=57.72 TRINITY_DN24048_c0_g1_i1:70-828(+)
MQHEISDGLPVDCQSKAACWDRAGFEITHEVGSVQNSPGEWYVAVEHLPALEEADQVEQQLKRSNEDAVAGARARLLSAVKAGDAPVVLQLISKEGDLALCHDALRFACHRGSTSVVRELLGIGVSMNCICPKTQLTPIHLAAAAGHATVCEMLLDAQADVEHVVGGKNVLALLRHSGHADIEEAVIRHLATNAQGGEDKDGSYASFRNYVLPRGAPYLETALKHTFNVEKDDKKDKVEQASGDDPLSLYEC